MDNRLVLPVNTILDGSYRVLRVVGSGGFGITYEAEDINLGKLVAIKEYYPHDFGDRDHAMSVRPKSEQHKHTFERGRSSFLEEARTLARFEHPGIVRVTRVFLWHSNAYMVMRFEHGLSFEAWLTGLGRPPTQEELDFVTAPLLDALAVMHAANFLHRDIAPDNIIIRADGTPVLLDFGAARRTAAEISRSLTGVVKAGYSPHEQYSSDGRLQGPWSDIYALGGTLYRAVVGKPPDEATLRFDEDQTASATQAAKGEYRQEFLAAIDACLKVKFSERPRSLAELRPMLLGPKSRLTRPALFTAPTFKIPSKRVLSESGRTAARRVAKSWPAIAATITLLAGAYGGLQYRSANKAEARQHPVAETSVQRQAALDLERRRNEEEADARQRQRQIEEDRKRAEAAEARRKEDARIAALEEVRRKGEAAAAEEKRREAERLRLAAIPSNEERVAFVKRVQEALKRNQCYTGEITGRPDDAQAGVDRFLENASKKGGGKPAQIKLAKASVGDFESWLKDVDAGRWDDCAPLIVPKAIKAKPHVPEQVARARPPREEREPSRPRIAPSYEGGDRGGGSSPILGIGH